jgi:hypothetical protein
VCNLPPVRPRSLTRFFVAAAGASLTLVATSCSSTSPQKEVVIRPTTNTGLCKLVAPSVVATVLSATINDPETLVHDSTTQCEYLAKSATDTAVIIRYDTDSSYSTFAKSRTTFERRGLALGPINDLGDQAYYFDEEAGKNPVTTVVVLKDSLQLLVTGSGKIGQIGAIARYALNEYEAKHPTGGEAKQPTG